MEDRVDQSGKAVETVVRFSNETRKVVVNIYRTNFSMMVNGRDYLWLVDSFLEEFLVSLVDEEKIDHTNNKIRESENETIGDETVDPPTNKVISDGNSPVTLHEDEYDTDDGTSDVIYLNHPLQPLSIDYDQPTDVTAVIKC